MSSVITFKNNPPRIYIFGRHLHHGRTGEFLIALGLVLLIHDRHDWPFRFMNDFHLYEQQ